MSLFSLKRDSIGRARIKCNFFLFCFWSTRCLNITFVEFLASCFFPACGLVRLARNDDGDLPNSICSERQRKVSIFVRVSSQLLSRRGDLRMIIGPYFKHTALRDAMNLWLNALISRWSFVLACCWESSAHANKPPISIRLDTKRLKFFLSFIILTVWIAGVGRVRHRWTKANGNKRNKLFFPRFSVLCNIVHAKIIGLSVYIFL